MKDKIIDTIREYKLLDGCKGLILCISGGSDSMSLLHFFYENKGLYGIPFVVAHVNHGLRAESEDEERMLESYCSEREVPIEILHAKISESKPKGKSTEEYAREVRYKFFSDVREKYGYSHIATAHNADDNGETILLNLIRGCGISGLKGIPVKRDDGIIRPLIRCSKKEIYSYCCEHGIAYATDKTNFENIYTRNIVRNELVPLIEKINPSFNEAVIRLSNSASADDTYLETLIDKEIEHGSLSLSYLRSLPESLLSRYVRRYFFVNSPKIVLTNKQTNDIIYLIKESDISKRIVVQGVEIRRSYDSLIVSESSKDEFSDFELNLEFGENLLDGIGTIIVSEETVTSENVKNCISVRSPLIVRNRISGDCVKFPKRPEKTLKKLFVDDKIPLDKRSRIPIVVSEGEIVWVGGYGSAEKYRPKIGSVGVCFRFFSQFE